MEIIERSSGFWIVDESGVVDGPFDDEQQAKDSIPGPPSPFLQAVNARLKGLQGIDPGVACGCCSECNSIWDHEGTEPPEEQPDDEGGFSWSDCDSCGSSLGGNRYAAHTWREGEDVRTVPVTHLSICEDCLVFHANGDEPENWES